MERTSEVLNKAADLIEQRGWTHGGGWHDDGSGLCLEGGIIAAAGLEHNDYLLYTCPAYKSVRAHLDDKCPWLWNDSLPYGHKQDPPVLGWVGGSQEAAVRISQQRVIEVLRACAVIEQAREEQDAAWATYAGLVTA